MNGVLPHGLERIVSVIGVHQRLPLTDSGLEDQPLGWVRVRPEKQVLTDTLREAGCRISPARRAERAFLLVRTPAGDRVEVEQGVTGAVSPVDAFAESFDRAIQARRAGSSVGTWLGANDAIASLLATVVGTENAQELAAARNRMPKALREELKELRVGLNLRHSLSEMRTILAFAKSLARWLGRADLGDNVDSLSIALEADRFWNLRDVARWWAPHVRPGVLLRGRPPATYADEGFWELASRDRITRFVDLRGTHERLQDSYPEHVTGCASIPIGGDPRVGHGDLDAFYASMPPRAPAALSAVLEAIAASDGPVLIHCRAGVDRTGVVVALIGTWLGVPRGRIVADYLASGQLVEAHRLLLALEVAEQHGIERLFADVSPDVARSARDRFLA